MEKSSSKNTNITTTAWLELQDAVSKADKHGWFSYRGQKVKFDHEQHIEVVDGMKDFVADVVCNLKDQFPDNELLSSLAIFDFRSMPDNQEEWLKLKAEYGRKEIAFLYDHFSTDKGEFAAPITSPLSAVMAEWEAFKCRLWGFKVNSMDFDSAYKFVYKDRSYPHMQWLSSVYNVTVHSSVCCEDGFKTMNEIKTKPRNRLETGYLDVLMQIVLNGPNITDEGAVSELLERAQKHWNSIVKRCSAFSHPGVARPRQPKKQKVVPVLDLLNKDVQVHREKLAEKLKTQIEGREFESSSSESESGTCMSMLCNQPPSHVCMPACMQKSRLTGMKKRIQYNQQHWKKSWFVLAHTIHQLDGLCCQSPVARTLKISRKTLFGETKSLHICQMTAGERGCSEEKK